MTHHLGLNDFTAHINEAFTLPLVGGSLTFELIEAQRAGRQAPPQGMREPISLLFVGPLQPLLRQQMMGLEHPSLGRVELFLVPIGPREDGCLYQSILA